MLTIEYHIWGVVQGVGFRPFIARLADKYGLKGRVYNQGGGVYMTVSGQAGALESFEKDITDYKPQPSEIVHLEKRILDKVRDYSDFSISASTGGENDIAFISPDLSVCESCEKELADPSDPRYRHPFISCMECGPRYSIIDSVPYDRDSTSMVDFRMCGFCIGQYTDMDERRFHAQTISCHNCGPQLEYTDLAGTEKNGGKALQKAVAVLNCGEIIAVKGIGGYHLACSALDEDAIKRLRLFKGRENKPFAVMFRDMHEIRKYCWVSKKEALLLQGKAKPIVLLEHISRDIPEEVGKGSRFTGCFLPYTPLQKLILENTPALVTTSANISDSPIIKEDEQMLSMLGGALAGVLHNGRAIRVGIDDSVVRAVGEDVQFIRRSRGYAPLPVYIKSKDYCYKGDILAMGGQTKNTFSLVKHSDRMSGSLAYLSQHMGDLDELRTYENYISNIEHMKKLLDIRPERICCDLHPGYRSTSYGQSLGGELVNVQHHYAHIASVMAEKGIFDRVIGIAFDGTGYGTDGKIWGGEFMICSPFGYSRAAHLDYVPMPGGDASVREAWKSAAAYLHSAGVESNIRHEGLELLKSALSNRINTIDSSSMGRLFDAVSSILDISHTAAFEGESAILLENRAAQYLRDTGGGDIGGYSFGIESFEGIYKIKMTECIKGIVEAKSAKADTAEIAYRFHRTVVDLTTETCRLLRDSHGISKVAVSGGVFQNAVLFSMLVRELKKSGFEIYYNTMVPPNDGGIALGQAFAGIYQTP